MYETVISKHDNKHKPVLLLTELFTGSENKYFFKKKVIFSGCYKHTNETETAIHLFLFHMLGNTSTLVPCGQKEGGFG